jgi:hypothetical protein
MSILITAASSAQAYQIKSVIHTSEPVLLGDYTDIPELMVKNGTMIKTPDPASASFAHEMLTLCLDKGVSMLFPLRNAELVPLAEARQLFLEFDIQLILPKIQVIDKHTEVTDGSIVVLNRSEIIGGDREITAPHTLTDGIFKINNKGDYQVFTAD